MWDRELHGFGVQVVPSGLKSFVIQYRTPEGRNHRAVIGRFGLMKVEVARKHAHAKLVAVSKGVDPIAEEANGGGLLTVADICDWYLAEAAAGQILGRRRRPIKPSTLVMDRSRIEAHIKPLPVSQKRAAMFRCRFAKLYFDWREQQDPAGRRRPRHG